MSNFIFDSGIPFAQNNPSSDQPKMLANNIANEGIWDVDHIGFNSNNGGTHLQTSFEGFVAPALLPGVPASVAYPSAGMEDSTRAQYLFKNSNNTVLLSAMKAFGVFSNSNTTGAVSLLNGYNVATISVVVSSGINTYTITLNPNTTASNNAAVFLTNSNPTVLPTMVYSLVSNVLTIVTTRAVATLGVNINFSILQF